jgi:uncharacterized protein YecA (UPF0149 family)
MPDVKIGRNDPCHCGSTKKYKKCCEEKDSAKERATLEKKYQQAVKEASKKAEDEQTAEQATNPGAVPKSVPQTSAGPKKHQTVAAPKFNIPRRVGGG